MDYPKEHVEAFEKEVVMHTSPMMRLKGYIIIIISFFFLRYVELSKTFAINTHYLLQSLWITIDPWLLKEDGYSLFGPKSSLALLNHFFT